MDSFHYRDNILHVDDVPLTEIAARFGTPSYVYSLSSIESQYTKLSDALKKHVPANQLPLIAYACKANSHTAILSYLGKLGAGADVVSGGELARALKAGVSANKIIFSGVGKSPEELKQALAANIYQINVESEPELAQIASIASDLGIKARVAFRVNPDVDAKTHAKITTGKAENKFGVDIKTATRLYEESARHDHLKPVGLSMHIGSQLTDVTPFREAYKKLAGMVTDLRGKGLVVEQLDIGGGLGIVYTSETPIDVDEYARIVGELIAPLGTKLAMEPGRYLVGSAGLLLSQVIYIKSGQNRQYMIMDAGMNDLIRPTLYDAIHPLQPVTQTTGKTVKYDVVGPVCETGDTFLKDYDVTEASAGDLMAFMKSGAYSAVMASHYNSRTMPAEILVKGKNAEIIRPAITVQDIIDKETIPAWV